MPKTISIANKRIIGPMIRLERLRLGLTKEQLIHDNQGKSICSLSTLYRIEKGKVIQDDIIYYDLIKKLNRSYEENSLLDNAVKDLSYNLVNYFETLNAVDADEILSYLKSFNKINSFYYKEIFSSCTDILHVSLNQRKLTPNEYQYYQRMMEFMPEPYNILLLHLCFCHVHNYNQDISEICSYEPILMKYQSYLFIQTDFLLLLRCERRFIEYQKIHSTVMDKIDKRNLINQKCKVLSYYVGTIADIQKPELCNTLKELEQLLNNEKQRLNSAIYSNVLLMLAMTYYVDLKDYRKASLLFESLFIEDPLKIYSSGIYYFSACDLSRIKPLQEILDKIDINQANIYLRYFYCRNKNAQKHWVFRPKCRYSVGINRDVYTFITSFDCRKQPLFR